VSIPNASHVAPAVGHLLSEENEDTGSVFVRGRGFVQRVAQFQNEDVKFTEPPSLGEIGMRSAEISEKSNAKPGTNPVG
jgi:hypothetical protein